MDGQRRELKNAGLYAENGIIKKVGPSQDLPTTADTDIESTSYCVSQFMTMETAGVKV